MMKKMIFLSIISISFAAMRGMEDQEKPSEHFIRHTRKFFEDMKQCGEFFRSEYYSTTRITPLTRAAYLNNKRCAAIFIALGIENNDDYYRTPLCASFERGNVGIAKSLLENGENINGLTNERYFEIPLHKVFSSHYDTSQCIELVDLANQYKANMNQLDCIGRTALHMVAHCWGKTSPCIRRMIELGADPKCKDMQGDGPLACLSNRSYGLVELKAIDVLIEGGADVNDTNKEGKTALHFAVLNENVKLVKALVEKHHSIVSDKDIDLVRPARPVVTSKHYPYNSISDEIFLILQEAMRNQSQSKSLSEN